MKKTLRVRKIIIIPLCVIFLTGCWDSRDVEKKDILTALIVDYKDNEYYYYTEIANIAGKTSQGGENQTSQDFNILISRGNTFDKARDDFNRKSVKELFLGAARILVFTDRMTKEGIEEYVNRLRGQSDYRKSILIAITDDEPEDIIKTKPENAASIGFAIESNLNNLTDDGTSFSVNVGDILRIMAVKKAGFLIPYISIRDGKTSLTGYSVFDNKNERIGQISAQKREGVVFLLNNKSKFYDEIHQSNRNYTVSLALKSKSIKPEYINNQLVFNVHMKFDSKISLINKMAPISQEDYASLKKKIEELTQKQLEEAIDTSQNEYKCDYLDFYKYYRIYYYKEFEKADWNKVYSDAKINVSTQVNITETDIPLKQ